MKEIIVDQAQKASMLTALWAILAAIAILFGVPSKRLIQSYFFFLIPLGCSSICRILDSTENEEQ